jgi:hypothetical protein
MSKARDIASAIPAPSTVSSAELGYLDGVTSAIQTQVDAKIAKTLTTTTGDIIYASGANTPARLGIGSSAQVLTVSGGVPSWATPAGGGKVLQVVQGTTSTSTTVASTSYTDTGLSASITPSSATSKVLVMVAQKYILFRTASPTDAGVQIIRGATSIVDFGLRSAHLYATPLSSEIQSATIWSPIFLDSPSTTSSTTYKTQAKLADTGSSHSIQFQQYSGTSVMILMEIGA